MVPGEGPATRGLPSRAVERGKGSPGCGRARIGHPVPTHRLQSGHALAGAGLGLLVDDCLGARPIAGSGLRVPTLFDILPSVRSIDVESRRLRTHCQKET